MTEEIHGAHSESIDQAPPVVELVATTRPEEARTAMATVAALRDDGVPIRDIAVVVRSLDGYEEPLARAATQFGVAPSFWTQLRVTRTRPYALVESVCRALDGEIDREALCRPLEHRWTPLEATDGWPIEPPAIYRARDALPEGARSIDEWVEVIDGASVDDRIGTFVAWLRDCPDPRPDAIDSVLRGVVDAYADNALPETRDRDSPALLATETEARAVVRVRTLVGQLRRKFDDRLSEGTIEPSWAAVAELADVIATQRPGRREHSNARALDVFEANDVWALDIPYVVAVGLTADEWPTPPASTVPPEFQAVVLDGAGNAGTLAPRPTWTDGRDRDQFADTCSAAGEALIVTRHTRSAGGDTVHPSPFLDRLDPRTVAESDRQRLVGTEQTLPPAIRRIRSGESDE